MNNNFKIKKNGRTKKWMYMDNNYSFRNSLWRDHYFLILNLFLILFFIFLYILNQKYLKQSTFVNPDGFNTEISSTGQNFGNEHIY